MSFGRFDGNVSARWLQHQGDDRDMKLLEDFSYTDQHGATWNAPKGSVINGASIPSALWSTVGAPYVGDYRRASVVHDVACVERKQPHEAVHLMFFNAMRADGVGWVKANVMYQAVKQFGPRWGATGRILKRRSAPDSEILAFADAVERAAQQVDEAQGLEAVAIQADKIQLAELADAPKDSEHEKSQPSRGRKRVSKVTKAPEPKGPPSENEAPFAISQLAPAVRKHFATTRMLSHFRTAEMQKLEPAIRSYVSQQSVADATVASAASDGGPSPQGVARASDGSAADGLTDDDRLLLVDQALVLLEKNYVHLPLKEAMYGVNPVQKLKLLREEVLRSIDSDTFEGDMNFHRKLLAIFLSTRDLHTNYLLPSPFSETTAYLPFLVEDYFDPDDAPNQRRFLVTRTFGEQSGSFVPGIEILRWNGVPIERAVEMNGERFAGSNREASRARGLETLTVRPFMQSLPPDEDFVLVEYRALDGSLEEARFEWFVFSPETADMPALQDHETLAAASQGIDLEQAMVRMAKRVLFAPAAVAAAEKMAGRTRASKKQGLQSLMPDVLEARPITVDSIEYGYVRIRSFSVPDADRFVREFVRLVELLPPHGLIIDVRGNGGGLITAGEQLLQTLTPRTIHPTLFQLLNTPLNRKLVEQLSFLSPWRDSMRQAVQTGAAFSQGFPITSPAKANEVGQRYQGPVVLITDALCYSTTDIFAAGFQDHEIGAIIGIDNNTGAGGANVWPHTLLKQFLSGDGKSPYQSLPSNSQMRVSMRRTIRVAKSNGTILEDLGVVPDVLHPMSRADLLSGNVDLLARAARILAGEEPVVLKAEIVGQSDAETTITVETQGLDRVDFFDDARPLGSTDVADGAIELVLAQREFTRLRLLGFSGNDLMASRVMLSS